MSVDLALLCLVLLFALIGAATGAARQIANVLALVIAYASAGPAARLLAPRVAQQWNLSAAVAIVATTLILFLLLLVLARLVLLAGLERMFAGDHLERRDVDRTLGFVLGGALVAGLAWVVLSALTFVEDNVRIGGRRFNLIAGESKAVAFARRHNLFERAEREPGPVKDLLRVAALASDPKMARRLSRDPAWHRLERDPRFQHVLKDPRLRRAVEAGNYRALLESSEVAQLLKDPAFVAELEALAQRAE